MDLRTFHFVYTPTASSPADFVAFWSKAYNYKNEHEYSKNIFAEKTPENLRTMLRWKMAPRFADKDENKKIIDAFIDRIDEARRICETATAEEFLTAFADGGPIYRIFWAHCWQPNRFPIYDQHVHRAMMHLRTGTPSEIPVSQEKRVIKLYLAEYVPFHELFAPLDLRDIDRALWAFGAFIKKSPFPLLERR